MLMLKMLVLKMVKKEKNKTNKQCIAIIHYQYNLSLSGRDDTKQAISFVFIVVPQAEQVPKVKKKKEKEKK